MRTIVSTPRIDSVVERVDLDDEDALGLVRVSGETEWRFDHRCKILHYANGEQLQLRCAPKLAAEHTVVVNEAGAITVTPSILCPDCELHGFVDRSTWRHA